MSGFWKCFLYLLILSILAFLFGRILPKRYFIYEKFPFRTFQYEKSGDYYIKFGVRKWKDKLPDMSVIFPKLIPSKKLPHTLTEDMLELMLQETCIAEWIHEILIILGMGCLFIWNGIGGWGVTLLYAFGNIPYIIIQRYNRPKLLRLLERQSRRMDKEIQS